MPTCVAHSSLDGVLASLATAAQSISYRLVSKEGLQKTVDEGVFKV